MKTYDIGSNIKQLRINANMTQEDLAKITGVSNQAVSKWESNQSAPDIFLLPVLAELFGVTIDAFFGRITKEAAPSSSEFPALPWPNDRNLRAVMYLGHTLLSPDPPSLDSDAPFGNFELHYSGNVENVLSSFAIKCENSTINNMVSAGDSVYCGDVNGHVNAGDSITCGDVGGNVSAGDSVTCGDIGGSVSAGDSVTCENIGGSATAETIIRGTSC